MLAHVNSFPADEIVQGSTTVRKRVTFAVKFPTALAAMYTRLQGAAVIDEVKLGGSGVRIVTGTDPATGSSAKAPALSERWSQALGVDHHFQIFGMCSLRQ